VFRVISFHAVKCRRREPTLEAGARISRGEPGFTEKADPWPRRSEDLEPGHGYGLCPESAKRSEVGHPDSPLPFWPGDESAGTWKCDLGPRKKRFWKN